MKEIDQISSSLRGMLEKLEELRKCNISNESRNELKKAKKLLNDAWFIIANLPELDAYYKQLKERNAELKRLTSDPEIQRLAKEFLSQPINRRFSS